MTKQTNLLLILDGYGLKEQDKGNAVAGNSPHITSLAEKYPSTQLECSGVAVGLPGGQMGNSEVGHLNIGAGRIVYQDLTRISEAIDSGSFFENAAFLDACGRAKKTDKKLHLMGLVSDGGVHSHMTHIYALLRLAKMQGLEKVFVHCFLDGRDTPPQSGGQFICRLENEMKQIGVGKIATVCGRYYAMDRDKRWERLEVAYDMLTKGVGTVVASAAEAIRESYLKGTTDEFVLPVIADKDGNIESGDSVIFFNFRPDRAREITSAFTQEDFDGFSLEGKKISNLKWVCLTQYDEKFSGVEVAFSPQSMANTLGEFVSKQGLKQLRIAETEKYAHVTFFFNGGVEKPNQNEERVLIDSPKVATYDLLPQMSAEEITDRLLQLLENNYDMVVLNYANCDMVGHTGVLDATKTAVKTVDKCVQTVVDAVLKINGRVFITSDHGNAENMIENDGTPFTAHTCNKVPFILVGKDMEKIKLRGDGKLCDIAPTMLELMNLEKPEEMTGKSLIVQTGSK